MQILQNISKLPLFWAKSANLCAEYILLYLSIDVDPLNQNQIWLKIFKAVKITKLLLLYHYINPYILKHPSIFYNKQPQKAKFTCKIVR